ncbi:RDD family protein [Kitasatospora sp. NPDC050543]|uniref:RDD family protein n=1 Tax=Kitasatospora sp. NPDC050543 TaxID=3364054 RepID=UPI0037A5E107
MQQFTPWWSRVLSYLIDWILVGIPTSIADLIDPGNAALQIALGLVSFALWVYNRCYLAGKGQSWGKMALGTHLHSEATGRPIGTFKAFLRDLCHILDALPCYLGFLWPIWDDRRQTFADKIMSTVVTPVETPLPEPVQPQWPTTA